jgi:hypothetical protein
LRGLPGIDLRFVADRTLRERGGEEQQSGGEIV